MRYALVGSALASALVLVLACQRRPGGATTSGSATASPSGVASSIPNTAGGVYDVIRSAEERRTAKPITQEMLSSREEAVRRAAVRALARIADEDAREPLLAALADESDEVVRLAAFGVGRSCRHGAAQATSALALRGAALLAREERAAPVDALSAIADALARCGGDDAEHTLRAWLALDRPIAEAAALALGRLAARRGKLTETTLVALLDAATAKGAAPENALYGFTVLSPPAGAIERRLLEVASGALERSGPARRFAVRALGKVGPDAVPALAAALAKNDVPFGEQCEIARELARLGAGGQAALAEALRARVPEDAAPDYSASPGPSDVLLAILESLAARSDALRPTLERLARLALPDGPRERARAIALRCAAARLLAGTGTANADLRACDPDPEGTTGKLALIAVLDRGELTSARGRRYRTMLNDPEPIVRQDALRALAGHRELEDAPELLARALEDAAPGVVATAAELLAKHPERASEPNARPDARALRPDPRVVSALGNALRKFERTPNVEVHAALIDATAALGLLGFNQEIERACHSDNPTLRDHAERARATLGAKVRCRAEAQGHAPSPAPGRARRIVFTTDAGELHIELAPEEAPRAAARLAELAKRGFYDGLRVHRVVPGFVVQLGDPGGDGYGTSELPPLRCELGPTPFEPGAVGMARSGPDTANSQFFVTLGRFPHLDGEYTRVGRAGSGWDRLRQGDRIHRVRVE